MCVMFLRFGVVFFDLDVDDDVFVKFVCEYVLNVMCV